MTNSEDNLIANTLYIFLLLVFVAVVLAGASFAVREYTLSLKHAKKAPPQTRGGKEDEEVEEEEVNAAEVDLGKHSPRGWFGGFGGFKANSQKEKEHASSADSGESKSQFHENDQTLGSAFEREDDTSLKCSLSPMTSPPHLIDIIRATTSPLFGRRIYLEGELRTLHPPPPVPPPANPGPVKISSLLQFERPITAVRFSTADDADQAIFDASALMAHKNVSARSIGAFRLAAIGVTHKPYDNATHFLATFCEVIESIVDSVSIYSDTRGVPGLQKMAVDLVSSFCWEHWHWPEMAPREIGKPIGLKKAAPGVAKADPPSEIIAKLAFWGRTPSVLSRLAIFRLLCNLYLGAPALVGLQRSGLVFKLASVFRACASSSYCLDHRLLIPMIAQAVAAATRDSIKALLYDVLLELLRPHVDCCVAPQDVFLPSSDLQDLVLHGLGREQAEFVRERAANLARILAQKYPEVSLWCDKNEPTPAPKLALDKRLQGTEAPGAWQFFE